ncbi:MAG TPA: phosphotransferase [Actinokineospora sp.]|jgi:streptomycin 6-kinase|nr:phosphotransferase [Actinokineospora sp.]
MNLDQQFAVPENVATAVVERWAAVGASWLDATPHEFVDLCRSFDAEPETVFAARFGFVVAVIGGSRALVMKSTPDPDGRLQAQAAVGLAAVGVGPAVHEVIDSTGTWTIMDRVRPGTPVVNPNIDQVAELLRPLATTSGRKSDLPPLSDWLRARLQDSALKEIPPWLTVAPEAVRDTALALLDDLESEHGDGLCHGDCSVGNVLEGPTGLALIDPRGKSGDVAYDVGVVAFKRGFDVRRLARLVGVDPDRAAAWARVADAARV